jgi:hypothetical protein
MSNRGTIVPEILELKRMVAGRGKDSTQNE